LLMVVALLVGIGMLLVSQASYGLATVLIDHIVVTLIRRGCAGQILWKNVAVMTIVTLVTA
jgi:hypothetical protein